MLSNLAMLYKHLHINCPSEFIDEIWIYDQEACLYSISATFLCGVDPLQIDSKCPFKQHNLALVISTFTPLIDFSNNWEFSFLPIKLYNSLKDRGPGIILLNLLWKIPVCSISSCSSIINLICVEKVIYSRLFLFHVL